MFGCASAALWLIVSCPNQTSPKEQDIAAQRHVHFADAAEPLLLARAQSAIRAGHDIDDGVVVEVWLG